MFNGATAAGEKALNPQIKSRAFKPSLRGHLVENASVVKFGRRDWNCDRHRGGRPPLTLRIRPCITFLN